MASDRNSFFKLSGKFDRPAYPGFIVMKMAMSGETRTCLPTNSTLMPAKSPGDYWNFAQVTILLPVCCPDCSLLSFWLFSASWMVWICCDTADSMRSSSRLNSSKQPHAPTWHRPTKIRPIAWKSKVSSQLNTSTKRPSWLPSAFTDSVFPVPAGPKWAKHQT